MSDHPEIDPDLFDVLEALERGARSRLFGFEPRALFRAVGRSELTLRSITTGLTALDRHVLEVHRHELAYLLRWAIAEELLRSGRGVGCPFDRIDRADWEQRLDMFIDVDVPADVAEAREAVKRGLSGEGLEAAERARILAITLALEETPNARCYLAWSYALSGKPASALRTSKDLLRASVSISVRTSVLQCIGAVLSNAGESHQSLRAYRRAADVAIQGDLSWPACATPLFHVILYALAAERPDQLRRASNEIANMIPVGSREPRTMAGRLAGDLILVRDSERIRSAARKFERELLPPVVEFIHALA